MDLKDQLLFIEPFQDQLKECQLFYVKALMEDGHFGYHQDKLLFALSLKNLEIMEKPFVLD